jgi:microcystin-dependent protein
MSSPYIGEIIMFGGNFAPRSYAFCDGSLLSISQFSALFSILGTTYGGDGETTFGLPDLRGRIPVHAGSGPGLTQRRPGQNGGAENTTLTINELPSHSHAEVPGAPELKGTVFETAPNTSNPTDASLASVMTYHTTDALDAEMQAGAVEHPASAASGGGQADNNMAPFQTINFVIALEGIFPSRN